MIVVSLVSRRGGIIAPQQLLHPLVRGPGGSLALSDGREYSSHTWCRETEAEHYRWPSPSLPPTLKKGPRPGQHSGGQVLSGHRTKVKINNSNWDQQ